MKITLDTNCIINLLDTATTTATSSTELAALIRAALSGEAEIAITTRVEADMLKDKDAKRRAEMLQHLEMFPVIGSVARFDTSKWDSEDAYADGHIARLAEDLTKVLFPALNPGDKRYGNKLNDVDHLVGHVVNRRDIFVTDDNDMLRKAETLKRSPGIVVMSPADCLAYLNQVTQRKQAQPLPSSSRNATYHSKALAGRVTFDYSNNNGRYSIGDGHFLFETAWSKASQSSIHAYSDPASIDAVALAKGASRITDIKDATAYDYSSRVRSPCTGQIVVWRNVNGLYAATQIVGIKIDSRGAMVDELAFDYVVLDDGSSDFSA